MELNKLQLSSEFQELNMTELTDIDGGGFWGDFGYAVGSTIAKAFNNANSYDYSKVGPIRGTLGVPY